MSQQLQREYKMRRLREATLPLTALLDTREAHELGEVQLPERKVYKKKKAGMPPGPGGGLGPRGGANVKPKTPPPSVPVVEAPEEIERRLVGEEDLELARLFLDVASHGKSKEPSTLMRPDLKAFVGGLSFAQRKGAQKRVNERVAAITEEAPYKVDQMRRKLDRQGIFHPNANALRAESMLQVELRRRLKVEVIQEEVFDAMLKEEQMAEQMLGMAGGKSELEQQLNKVRGEKERRRGRVVGGGGCDPRVVVPG